MQAGAPVGNLHGHLLKGAPAYRCKSVCVALWIGGRSVAALLVWPRLVSLPSVFRARLRYSRRLLDLGRAEPVSPSSLQFRGTASG